MDAWVVVGLGNPGPTYADTRHNVGQMTLDELARRAGTAFRSHKGQAQVADVRLGTGPGGAPGPKTVLAKPTSYMNVSGGPVAAVLRMNGAMPDRLVVVHDDLDIGDDVRGPARRIFAAQRHGDLGCHASEGLIRCVDFDYLAHGVRKRIQQLLRANRPTGGVPA